MKATSIFRLFVFFILGLTYAEAKIVQVNEENGGIAVEEYLPGYQHHDGLWFDAKEHLSYEPLANHIYQHLIAQKNVTTILELGAGAGSLAYHLRQLDPTLTIVTVDGNQDTVMSPYIDKETHFIARTDKDLDFFYENGERVIFDLVLSFEHFEHIQHDSFPVFLNNLRKHISKKSLCFCTAANWGGPGIYEPHCNVKTLKQWQLYLRNQGFACENTSHLGDIPTPFNFSWPATSKLLFRLNRKCPCNQGS